MTGDFNGARFMVVVIVATAAADDVRVGCRVSRFPPFCHGGAVLRVVDVGLQVSFLPVLLSIRQQALDGCRNALWLQGDPMVVCSSADGCCQSPERLLHPW